MGSLSFFSHIPEEFPMETLQSVLNYFYPWLITCQLYIYVVIKSPPGHRQFVEGLYSYRARSLFEFEFHLKFLPGIL